MKNSKLISLWIALIALLPVLSSCSKDVSSAAEQLLESVPASSSAVCTINIPLIVENIGGKVDGEKISANEKTLSAVKKIKDNNLRILFSRLMAGESGIDPQAAVLFTYNGSPVITGLVSDTEKLKTTASMLSKKKAYENDGFTVVGNFILKGERFWIFNSSANVDKAKEWLNLSKKMSFASNDNIESLIKCENPINGSLQINALLKSWLGDDFKTAATAQMALSLLFDDAENILVDGKLKKGVLTLNATVINSKGNDAHFNLDFDKIDDNVIKNLGGDAQGFAAFGITAKLVKQINNSLSSLGGTPSDIKDILDAIDGTCAFAFNFNSNALKGIVSLANSANTSALNDMLSSLGTTRVANNEMIVNSATNPEGIISSQEAADALKDAIFGAIFDLGAAEQQYNLSNPLSTACITLHRHNTSVRMQAVVKGKNLNESFLIQAL